MKIVFMALMMVLLSGCHWNPCPYCRHDREPDFERNEGMDMKDGYKKEVQTKVWVEYMKDDAR